MTTTRQQDLIDAIITDHREVEAVFGEIEGTSWRTMRSRSMQRQNR